MTINSKPNVRVLTDKVADKDELGSHQRIAESVAGLIESDQPGICVALTGSWGSGKSSVVRMAQDFLGPSTAQFVFDAWAHERDPLHRSFLEQLIDFLSEKKWISKDDWSAKKDLLSKRRETTHITHHRKPTRFGWVLSIAGLVVPLGLMILNQESWVKIPPLLLILGFILTLAPLGVVLGFRIAGALARSEEEKEQWRFVLSSKSTEDYRSDTYRTVDPTTIEFQKDYRKLLREALDNPNRKLVIVIDNLDRLDTKNALAMWASMKTFIDHSLIEGEAWSYHLWLLVPFDPIAMKAFWKRDGLSQPDEQHGDLASSFIDKTFQVTFHIPPPVLSNWIEFFETKLQWSLPDIADKAELHDVCRIFRLKRFTGTSYPTPREIKIFINRIGALYRQWHDQLSLRILAMYAVTESEENLVESLRESDPSLISPVPPQLLGPEYFLSLAAIHFNVPKEKAAHVLLGPKLEQHIRQCEAKEFGTLQQVAGFSDVLEEIVETNYIDWSKEAPSTICWLANRLDTMPPEKPSTKPIWNYLCRGASRVESWPNLNEEMGQGFVRLLNHDRSDEFARKVLRSLSKSEPLVAKKDEPVDAVAIAAWLKGLSVVIEVIRTSQDDDILSEEFECPGDAQMYYAVLREASGGAFPVPLIKYITPAAGTESIITIIGERVVSGFFNNTDVIAIEHLSKMTFEWPWATLLGKMETHLQAPAARKSGEVRAILGTLVTLSSTVKEADSALKNLAVAGHCLHHLHTTHAENHSEATSLCFYVMLKRNVEGTVPVTPPPGNMAPGQQVYNTSKATPKNIEYALDGLAGVFTETDSLTYLLGELYKHQTVRPLRLAIIDRVAERTEAVAEIGTERFVQYEVAFSNALDTEEYQELVDRFVVSGGLVENLVGEEFDSQKARLYRATYVSPQSNRDLLNKWILRGLSNVTEEEWKRDLDTTDYNLYDLLHAVRAQNVSVELGWPFREALAKYRDSLTSEQGFKRDMTETWPEMLDSLGESIRKTFIQDTINGVVDGTTDHADTIALFGPALLECDSLEAKRDDLVQKGFSRFVKKDRIEELRWFASVVSECPQVIKKCREEIKDTLKKELEHLLTKEEIESEKHKVLCEIAEAIGVPIPSPEEESTDDSASSAD